MAQEHTRPFTALTGIILLVAGVILAGLFPERIFVFTAGLAVMIFGGLGLLTYSSVAGLIDQEVAK